MKFAKKTYLLLTITIITAAINLALLFTLQQESNKESFSLVVVNEIKVKTSNIASLASSIAAGNENNRSDLQQEITETVGMFSLLEKGGLFNENEISPISSSVTKEFDQSYALWNNYLSDAQKVQYEPVFNSEVRNSINYVLNKNTELIVENKKLVDELSTLDRNYRRHQEIANDLLKITEQINSDLLLISLNDNNAKNSLTHNHLLYEANLRKLLGLPLDNLNLSELGIPQESLASIPEENLSALKQMDPLWESISFHLDTIESHSIISDSFGMALASLSKERIILMKSLDNLFNSWNYNIQQQVEQRQNLVQIITISDIVIFVIIIFIIRKSLFPLQKVTKALIKIKEGVYGEKIDYASKDEIGDLINTFNVMSETILKRENEAKKVEKAKDEFLAMITHELKTPLVPIQGYADILLKEHFGNLNEKQKERIVLIKESSSSLLQLISDLLDAQKLDLGRLRMIMANNNINSIILKSIELMKSKIKDTEIQIKFDDRKDIEIICDKDRIAQVITNIIKNGIEAIHTAKGLIEISVTDFIDKIQIAIKDDGPEIPAESLPHLFEKFYQADSSLTREKGGSGLGLAISKGIIDAHNGKIWVEQKPNNVTFFFTIHKNIPNNS